MYALLPLSPCFFFFFFNDTATTEIYTLSLHDALPISHWPMVTPFISQVALGFGTGSPPTPGSRPGSDHRAPKDRKSTRLNSSHSQISYAVFCLKKKNK